MHSDNTDGRGHLSQYIDFVAPPPTAQASTIDIIVAGAMAGVVCNNDYFRRSMYENDRLRTGRFLVYEK